jgi:hypothetical protein
MSEDEEETVRVSTSIPRSTMSWLREQYPDATSDSMRLVMAISDARRLARMQEAPRDVEICLDPEAIEAYRGEGDE